MCSIDVHIFWSYLFRIILDSKLFDEIQFYMVIYETWTEEFLLDRQQTMLACHAMQEIISETSWFHNLNIFIVLDIKEL